MASLFDVMFRGLKDTGFFAQRNELLSNSARLDALESVHAVGQTLSDLTTSRALNTTYTNTTNKIRLVSVLGQVSGSGSTLSATVGGVYYTGIAQPVVGIGVSIQFPVLPGQTYRVETSGAGTIVLTGWREIG